ncbi:uncharacterized protein LOC134749626 [Cydia strobilella]|uniref:uncharacterized protein LOC134749626 n=1 Tax=Cydia strobilella TaxID=1100964 RepID=UPI0030063F31
MSQTNEKTRSKVTCQIVTCGHLATLLYFFKKYKRKLYMPNENPIEEAKKIISGIQQFVGIRDVFGDNKELRWSPLSVVGILVSWCVGVAFLYTGPFSEIMYLVSVFPDKVDSFKAVNLISATCVPISKYIFMWTSRNRLKTIMKMSHEGLGVLPEGSPARARMLQTLHKAQGVSWLVILNQAIVHIGYLLLPLFLTVFMNGRYLPTTGESYGLTPKYETPYYEATFVITCVATAFSAINQTGYIVLFVTLVAHELGHFYVITETFNEIYKLSSATRENDDLRKEIDEKLTFCIRHHQFLIKYHGKISELYQAILGAQFLIMIIVLVTTLQTMYYWHFSNTIITGVAGIMPLTIYCFGGELIISTAENMSEAIYSCGWEMMEPRQARAVGFILCISQRPLHLTAAGVTTMNRDTFANVVQAVYKIYAVFN